MLAEFMNLGMTVMAAGNAVSCPGFLDLVILYLAELQTLLFETGLEKTAAAAATIIVGPVGLHVDKIFFAHNGFDHESQIIGYRIPKALAHDLTGVLNRKFDL
jgi:hypothetical protein